MRLLSVARKPTPWLRVALAALLVAFALNSIAHVTHRHDAAPSSVTHSLACGYCLSFDNLADAPRHSYAPLIAEYTSTQVTAELGFCFDRRLTTSARPRAPPLY
jgi:hypothetical protein